MFFNSLKKFLFGQDEKTVEVKQETFIVCPYCLQDNLIDRKTCEKCNREFTEIYRKHFCRSELVTAPIIGYTAAGKSVFLDSILYSLFELQRPELWSQLLLHAVDEETQNWFDGVRASRANGTIPPANAPNHEAKRVFVGRNLPLWGKRTFAFRDVAGENFDGFVFGKFVVDFCVRSHCAILVLDANAAIENPARPINTLFDRYVTTLIEHKARLDNRKILVVLSKADKLRGYLPTNLSSYLDADPLRGFVAKDSPYYFDLSNNTQLHKHCRHSLEELDKQLAAWVATLPGGQQMTQLAMEEKIDLRYTMVSGWGADPTMGANSAPLRMLDPLFQLLEFHSKEV